MRRTDDQETTIKCKKCAYKKSCARKIAFCADGHEIASYRAFGCGYGKPIPEEEAINTLTNAETGTEE